MYFHIFGENRNLSLPTKENSVVGYWSLPEIEVLTATDLENAGLIVENRMKLWLKNLISTWWMGPKEQLKVMSGPT